MDSLVLFLFKHEGLTVIGNFNQLASYDSIVEFVCSRWESLNRDNLSLFYVLPGNIKCVLDSEDDYKNMGIMVVRSGIKSMDIQVKRKGELICANNSSTSAIFGGTTSNEVEYSSNNGCLDLAVNFFHHDETDLLTKKWATDIKGVGQVFEGGITEFRIKLRKYATEVGFNFNFVSNDKKRVTAECIHKGSKDCPWRIHASIENANGFVYIKKFESNHTCGDVHRSGKGGRVNSNVVSDSILEIVRGKPSIGAAEVLKTLKTRFGLDVTYRIAWYALEKAREVVFGEESISYDNLRGYFRKMKQLDPSNKFFLESDPKTGHFMRCFVSFGACIKGFRYCRPLLFVDGTFLHGKFKGTLLAATAKDGNSGLFNLAFAIVGGEDTANWTWFMEQLKHVIGERAVTFVSDRHQGIITAIKAVMADCYHSFCMVHLKNNLKDKMKACHLGLKKKMCFKLSECAEAPTRELFHDLLEKMKAEGGTNVTQFLDNLPPENYANSYFNGMRYGEMSSNAAESFNAQFKDGRSLPIMELIDEIRLKVMAQMSKRREESASWTSTLCPLMDKRYNENIEMGRPWIVYDSSKFVYEVHSFPTMVVNIEDYTCTCGKWQQDGFPCVHALAALYKATDNPIEYIEPYFYTSYYRESYANAIHPYVSFGEPPTIEKPVILPPVVRRPPGRPRKNRIPSRGEITKRKITCSRCGKVGNHNRKSCKEPM